MCDIRNYTYTLLFFIISANANTIREIQREIYIDTFRLQDGSRLTEFSNVALNVMINNVKRLLSQPFNEDIINATRQLNDEAILKILYLAVAGNFVTSNVEKSALPQRCTLYVNPGTGALVLSDNTSTQNIVLECLVIISILCLLRAWSDFKLQDKI
jgi:hypothetical protein